MKVVKIRPKGYSAVVLGFNKIDDILNTVKEILTEFANNDSIVIDIVDMSKKEFENLSEFDGW